MLYAWIFLCDVIIDQPFFFEPLLCWRSWEQELLIIYLVGIDSFPVFEWVSQETCWDCPIIIIFFLPLIRIGANEVKLMVLAQHASSLYTLINHVQMHHDTHKLEW